MDLYLKFLFYQYQLIGFAIFLLLSIPYLNSGDENIRRIKHRFFDNSLRYIRIIGIVLIFDIIISISTDRNINGKLFYGSYLYSDLIRYILMILVTQLLWFPVVVRHWSGRIFIALFLIGMIYFEKLVIDFTSLHSDYLPSAWLTHGL